ncbi:PEP-CTERM sorting domain-containing protein [Massilia sp. IC2-476]|uniref:PEP-CTERM sorting domain-containing protein n=1 Tax=Massilia sp. IC2-476 TaxID=2887199 RepID=UPI001D110AFF|nr:PEP-CTERM sorting domain-containing protein [Massilia sp. IC2-476]MCC2973548.1 PEP-CTERM sorting domain-containing protein [Massilia sp. IC2-476]
MRPLLHLASGFLFLAAQNASAGVIKQDGVVFTSTYTGNVLTLEIDAANRSGGWLGASAIDALSLKTIGSFSGVNMSTPGAAPWALSSSELFAKGCGAAKASAGSTGMTRLCYTGPGIALADNMVFTFTFTGTPVLSAPHLKVHFIDAKGNKVGSLLSLDFPATPELIPAPVLTLPVKETAAANGTLPASPALSNTASNVPEPQSLALLAAGFAMLGLTRRRKS